MRRPVPGRVLAATVGGAGTLLALPQLVWPTHSVGVRGEGPRGGFDFRQSFWSWGRFADTTTPDGPQFDAANPVTLTLFVVTLLVGVTACAAFALRAGPDGRVLGAAGLGWALLGLGAPLAQRVGDALAGLYGDNPGLVVETLWAGWLQWVSVGLLLAAFALVVAAPLAATVSAGWPGLLARLVRLRESREHDEGGPADATGPRIGVATLRDLPAPDHAGGPGGVVGFSDDAADERGRWRPPERP